MPNLFAITTTTSSISLDSNRQAQVSFTVSNISSQNIRGHARLWTPSSVATAWLSVVGEVERDFASNESLQYRVQIAVPAGASPGEYTLRLDMVEVTNPDETLSEGPTVRFTVPVPVAVKPKPFPWWLVAAVIGAIVILVGGSIGIYRVAQKPVPTPTPIVHITPTVIPTPTPVPSPVLGTWSGLGTYNNGRTDTFNMLLIIKEVNGNTFTGTLEEDTYQSVVNVEGTIISSSGDQVQIRFTDPSRVSGSAIILNCIYSATISKGQMKGTWTPPGSSAPGGNIILLAVHS
ncbi:MAG TPA: hypothetical protein VFN35_30895 [Ktedonobacteraceae bacterium]|nr:hypothetical protein [Ktedonobacteraceae bacterium]